MEHDKGVHTHAAWDLIRAQSQPQSTWKKVGRWWTLQAGTSFVMADDSKHCALVIKHVDDFVHFYAHCCPLLHIYRDFPAN